MAEELDIEQLHALYDRGAYLEAYRLALDAWAGLADLGRFETLDLIALGRLAGRVGANGLRRRLMREALGRDPGCLPVRLRAWPVLHRNLLDELREAEALEARVLALGPGQGASSWLGLQALNRARVRDFPRAHALLERVERRGETDGWSESCQSIVLLMEDRWDEARAAAERAFERQPGVPWAANALLQALLKRGLIEETVRRLEQAAGQAQSYETCLMATAALCAQAERLGREQAWDPLARAARWIEAASGFAPLADRETRHALDLARMDVALVGEDLEALGRLADRHGWAFLREVKAHALAHPEGRRRLLPHRPLRQRHSACLPTSVATVLSGLGVELDPDAMAAEVTYAGTSPWRAIEWLRRRGLLARPFLVTPARARRLLEHGVPFVLGLEGERQAHAVAVVGLDERAGLLLAHDPSSSRLLEMLLERFCDQDAPIGPEGLLLAPADRPDLLALLEEEACAPVEAYLSFQAALLDQGVVEAERLLAELSRTHPGLPCTLRAEAMLRRARGEVATASRLLEQLLAGQPRCLPLRRDLLACLRTTRDQARQRACLAEVVERGRLPGLTLQEEWSFPPTEYLAEYADLLAVHDEGCALAERLLTRLLGRVHEDASVYHILGDVLLRQRRCEDSLLPLRLAAHLELENDHYAQALCDALAWAGRPEQGLAFLSSRVDTLGARLHGGRAWVAWIEALADHGRPDEARAAMARAQQARSGDGVVQGYAVRFWSRLGRPDLADQALAELGRVGDSQRTLQAQVALALDQGRWQEALEPCWAWCVEAPNDLQARHSLLDLVACDGGRRASLDLARRWVAERPGDDEVELLLYDTLRLQGLTREADALLRARLRRNPEDAWAWRELGFRLLGSEPADSQAAVEQLEELQQAVARAVALSPGDPATRMLQAEQALARGAHAEAIAWTLEALAVAPELGTAYLHAFRASAGLEEPEREAVLARLEENLERCPGLLHPARDLVLLIARQRGLARAQQTMDRLARRGAADPEWIEAQADLWLEAEGGQSQAARALELLERSRQQFPGHYDLRLSHAYALRLLGREQAEVEVLEELVRWSPTHLGSRQRLARHRLERGEVQAALDLLEAGARMRPQDRQVFQLWAQLARDAGRPQEAIRCGRRGVALQPDNLGLREQVLELHLELGEHEQALQLARAGTLQDSAPAYAWVLLARALGRHPGHTARGEAEVAYREALRRDGRLYDAADELATLLGYAGRHDEARALLEPLQKKLPDPCPVFARLAWLEREAGHGSLAVERMAEVVKRWPGHRFAIWHLLRWLEEDKTFPLARELLPELPAAARADPELVARWLGLMEQAGLEHPVLEEHWQRLLAEHPGDLGLHLLRSDWLAERRHWAEALAVLSAVEGKHPPSAFLVARKVSLLALGARPDQALDEAGRLWVLPGDDEDWPDRTAWKDLREAGLRERATARLLGMALGGTRVRQAALAELVESVGILAMTPAEAEALGMPHEIASVRGAGHLVKLYRALAEAPWDGDARLRALALAALVRRGRDSPELDRWLQLFLSGKREELLAHTPLWRQAVWFAAYQHHPEPQVIRIWLEGWSERPGVDMTAAAWLADGLRRALGRSPPAEAIEELGALCTLALERLEPDSTAGFLASVLGECGARLERPALVRAALEHGQRFWAGREMGDILPGGSPWTPQALRLLDELGRAGSPRELVVLSGRLGQLHGTKGMGRLRRAWRRWLRTRCGPWARLRAGLVYWWRHVDA